jgi:transposase
MLTVGIDAHHRFYAACVLNEHGKMIKEKSIRGGVEDVAAWVGALGAPSRVCYEASLGYGELHDALGGVAVDGVGTEVQVAHPGHLRAIFTSKKKNDRIDAKKLATALFLDQVPVVHVPAREGREWRQLIEHRRRQMDKRVRAMCALRAVLRGQGIAAPKRGGLWSTKGMAWLKAIGFKSPLTAFRRDQLVLEVEYFTAAAKAAATALDTIAKGKPAVALLMTIPGIGPRTAEAVAAYVDDPHRFSSTRKAGAYFGLVPSLDESAGSKKYGRITKQGPGTARKLLVEAAWQGVRHSPTLRAIFDRIKGGQKDRRGRALVATAHYLLKVMVAMMKSGEEWRERKTTEKPEVAMQPS